MAKILVTGGLGVVGSSLVHSLIERGNDVHICDLQHSHFLNYTRCDVSSHQQVSRLFSAHSFDYVYHLAAEFGRWNGEDFYDTLWRSNAIGTKNIIRMQEKYRFRLIFFSSSEVYGDYQGVMKEEVLENVAIKQLNDYAITKWVGEMQVENSRLMKGTESVRVRLFNTYGPGEFYSPYRSAVCLFTYRALHEIPYTVYLDHMRTSSYISDTANTLANICDNFIPGRVYNIAGTQYHDMKHASDLILKHIGISDDLVSYKEAEDHTTKNKLVDTSLAQEEIGLKSTISMDEGIPLTVDWMKQTYNID